MQQTRKVTAILLLCSAAIMLATALVLFFAPGSKEAAATGWNILGITKPSFKIMHQVFGVIMLVAATNHIILNRRAIIAHIKNSTCGCPISRDAQVAFVVAVVAFVASIVFGQII